MTRATPATVWDDFLATTRDAFGGPAFGIFQTLMVGWVLAPGRRTITNMICVGDPDNTRAHDAYHRFIRCGAWSLDTLWAVLTRMLVTRFCPTGPVTLDVDDTLFHKTGRNINGAGVFRDAVASTRSKVVYALGLNLVVVTLRVTPPWAGCPIALPVAMALNRKNGSDTTTELAETALRQLAGRLPDRELTVCGDGAYACLIGRDLPNTTITSRMRRDAAIYEAPPPPTGKPGRPRTKGDRLPTPAALANTLTDADFTLVKHDRRGTTTEALVYTIKVLWYAVHKNEMVNLHIVRDPTGHQRDDFFVTNDLDTTPATICARYHGRWSIEICFREVKQCLGAQNPQSWKHQGPERAAALSLWLYSSIWATHLTAHGNTPTWTERAWYRNKRVPSFIDALATLRHDLWTRRITAMSPALPQLPKIFGTIINALATAA